MSKKQAPFTQVIQNIDDWPIYKLSEDREAFIKELDDFTLQRILRKPTDQISDIIAKMIYLERIRIKEEPWKVDPPNERSFWRRIRKKLVQGSLDKDETEARATNEEILREVINRYSEEVVGTFNINTFLFARRFLTVFFNRLLNTAASRNLSRIWGGKHRLYERLIVKGQLEEIRSLVTKGTVVVVPTHHSNLDSILIGFAMDTILGLPSFYYGAGLNLYNTGYTAYYMNRLGAYRVDRRKKNGVYLEVLKANSNLAIRRGTNSLFFPGGTRSRSGSLETKLKMGLLGTAVEAQRSMCEKGDQGKVFIVPLILSYHFVLEAKFLIEQHLKSIGKENYIQMQDDSYSRRKILKFIWELFAQSSDIVLSFGKPMDVLGNFVDQEGKSYDRRGREVQIEDYFVSDGRVKSDLQRESEYTRILADRIVDRYHKENIVLTSHLVAFAVFNLLRHQNAKLDLFGLLRLPPEDFEFSFAQVVETVSQLRDHLMEMEKNGKIKLSEELYWEVPRLIRNGIGHLGRYHSQKPLKITKNDTIISEDFKVLFFYHNRLENYQLDKAIQWKSAKLMLEKQAT